VFGVLGMLGIFESNFLRKKEARGMRGGEEISAERKTEFLYPASEFKYNRVRRGADFLPILAFAFRNYSFTAHAAILGGQENLLLQKDLSKNPFQKP